MIDWNDAFDNSGYVDGVADLVSAWSNMATATRVELAAELDIVYGDNPRERFDLFSPASQAAGLVVFVHGGYWHKFDKSYWSHLAAGSVANGWAVAVVSYPLAPDVSIPDITLAVARSVTVAAERVSGPIRIAGHSAGGHLVSRMASDDTLLPVNVRERLARVVSISGVHDLRPLVHTNMNQQLRLTDESASNESPCLYYPPKELPVTFWVGAQERPEFLRQNRLIAEAWERHGCRIGTHYELGKNHFSVIESLQFAEGTLTKELLG